MKKACDPQHPPSHTFALLSNKQLSNMKFNTFLFSAFASTAAAKLGGEKVDLQGGLWVKPETQLLNSNAHHVCDRLNFKCNATNGNITNIHEVRLVTSDGHFRAGELITITFEGMYCV